MRLIRPEELKTVLKGDTAVAFVSDSYWEPHPTYEKELDAFKVSYIPFKKGETVHDDNQEWAVCAHTGWLIHSQTNDLATLSDLRTKLDSPVGGVLRVALHPDPHTRPALLIGHPPVVGWVVAQSSVWVRRGFELGYVGIERVEWGETLKSKAIVFHTGDALILSPQGGRRPYTLYTYPHIYPLSPKIW